MRPEHNLVLTGFMGTGKTTVGNEIATKLGMEFVDTDQLIESRHGPITRIFEERGEAEFRSIERSVALELGEQKGLVIATGGRMILDPENFRALSRHGRIFCLVATPDEVHARVTSDPTRRDRPLLQVDDPRQRIVELMTEREGQYERFPQLTTDRVAPEAIADELVGLWSTQATYDVASPDGGYPYAVGAGILPFVRQLADVNGPVVVVTDNVVRDLYAPAFGDVDLVVTLPAGRQQKTIDAVHTVYDQMFEAGVDKTATVVSLGTSIIGDVAGFVAATYMRGLELVHCPTNLIAMVDTSVGGKVGLDVPQGRNLIGLFKQPRAVVADVATLQTLPARDFASGLAEVVKHGLVASSSLLERIENTDWTPGTNRLPGALAGLQSLIAQAIQIKISIVQDDPFEEEGRRTFLNLGHTFGYGIEHASHGEINHGEAVGMGLVAAARLSEKKGYASVGLAHRVQAIIEHVGLNWVIPERFSADAMIQGMHHDKKKREAKLRFVLLRDVGQPFVSDDVTEDEIRGVLDDLRQSAASSVVASSQ